MKVYIINRDCDTSELGRVFYITPIYCAIVMDVKDCPLANQFTDALCVIRNEHEAITSAISLAKASGMSVLVVSTRATVAPGGTYTYHEEIDVPDGSDSQWLN